MGVLRGGTPRKGYISLYRLSPRGMEKNGQTIRIRPKMVLRSDF
jgi:hypothetical protein